MREDEKIIPNESFKPRGKKESFERRSLMSKHVIQQLVKVQKFVAIKHSLFPGVDAELLMYG